MQLREILNKHGISLYHPHGVLKDAIDMIQELYLKMNSKEITLLFREIEEEEKNKNLFQEEIQHYLNLKIDNQ